MKTAKRPRNYRQIIRQLTGLHLCDRYCGCGGNAGHFYFPPGVDRRSVPPWVPGWMNAVDGDEIWSWLVSNGKLSKAGKPV